MRPLKPGDTLATKSTELATVSTATSCRIQVVADLSPKPATKLTVSATIDFVADLSPVSATVDFVASVYRALENGRIIRAADCHSYREAKLNSGPKCS